MASSPAVQLGQRRKTMSNRLKDKIALITGGTEGIGLATAKLFAEEGAYVFITGRRRKELDEAVKTIGSNVSGVQGDVAKLVDLDRLYETVAQVKGRIDVVLPTLALASLLPWGTSRRGISANYSTSRSVGERSDGAFPRR